MPLFMKDNFSAVQASDLVGREVRFTTGVKTGRGLSIKKGERGRVVRVVHQPDGELVVVNVRNVGEIVVGNAGALELDVPR
jgi:flagellar hook assembly protein FlgD